MYIYRRSDSTAVQLYMSVTIIKIISEGPRFRNPLKIPIQIPVYMYMYSSTPSRIICTIKNSNSEMSPYQNQVLQSWILNLSGAYRF